ncbi:MAG: UDP-N-acetylglucosamine--N-acetylmuramyl-(pentapeptide) pyrophosphoryl-undecaprenol N-acetylglucosamine transferase [Patescibacteria group bacterium]|nr:UDP-N-acetylglucosamine--N-acetylmuramyl-(pentapeptide) pyrophosphoryl-undecaprenol N-acetylglucosamine transferase [Patescibacteria group bacterium]
MIKILLTGGGTGGSVSPLLAVASQLRIRNKELGIMKKNKKFSTSSSSTNNSLCVMRYALCDYDFLWLGTRNGPERQMVEMEDIKFKAIFSGKLRRYFSLKNITDLFNIIIGFFQAFFIIIKYKPNLAISAGSFVSVPIIWASYILRIPVLIHQQDVMPGLANKLMAPFAKVITVTFKKSLDDYGKKAVWTGNPIRKQFSIFNFQFSIQNIKNKFNLSQNLPIVLIMGGGTGAMAINKLVWKNLDELTKFCQIIHITGQDKNKRYALCVMRYACYKFLNSNEMAEAYAAANIVVSRCGMSVLTELAHLKKPAILIPMPKTHQEENAKIFKEKDAAIVMDQNKITSKNFVENIKNLLNNQELQSKLCSNISKVMKSGANENVAKIIQTLTTLV